MDAAAAAHPWLESGPLLPSPWYGSQFLSHALRALESKEEGFSYMAEYMNATAELGEYAQGFGNLIIIFMGTREKRLIYSFIAEGDGDRGSGYTLFAPRDDAFWRVLVQVEEHFEKKIFKRRKKNIWETNLCRTPPPPTPSSATPPSALQPCWGTYRQGGSSSTN